MKRFLLSSLAVLVMAASAMALSTEERLARTNISPTLEGKATADLPTAGREGKLMFDTTLDRVTVDNGSAWRSMPQILSASAALNFASAAATVCSTDLTITVTGAAVGDLVVLGVPHAAVNAGSVFTGWVSATDTVTVRHCNVSAGANDPASATFTASVLK